MSDKHYVGEVGTDILVDCGSDITGAITPKLKIKKPDNTVVEWDASVDGTNFLKHTTIVSDFDQAGKYYLQASIVLPGWVGLGETVTFDISKAFN